MLLCMTVLWGCQEERNVDESAHFEGFIPSAIEQSKSTNVQNAALEELIPTPLLDASQSKVNPTPDASVVNECFEEYGPDYCAEVNLKKTFVVRTNGCPVKVTATYDMCWIDPAKKNFVFVVKEYDVAPIHVDNSNPECVDFINTLIQHLIKWYIYKDELSRIIIDNLIRDAILEAELNWDSAFIEWFWSNSPPPHCQGPNHDANTVIEYYNGFCGQWCLGYEENENGEIIKIIPVKLKCGRLCCVRRSTFCKDVHTDEMVRETTIENLEDCTYEEPDPYPGCYFLGECIESCDH